jgi:ribosome modulation factor
MRELLRAGFGEVPRPGEIAAALLRYYQDGVTAALAGLSQDQCSYRRQDRRAAWLRGWHDGRAQWQPPQLTDQERARGKAGIARLRAATGERPRAEGWVFLYRACWCWLDEYGRTTCGMWVSCPWIHARNAAHGTEGRVCERCLGAHPVAPEI